MEDRHIVALFLRRAETAIAAVAKKYGTRLTALAQNILRDRAGRGRVCTSQAMHTPRE